MPNNIKITPASALIEFSGATSSNLAMTVASNGDVIFSGTSNPNLLNISDTNNSVQIKGNTFDTTITTFVSRPVISYGTWASATELLHLQSTDYGTGKSRLYFSHTAGAWRIGTWDGTVSNTGSLNITLASLQHNSQTVWTAGNDGAASGLDADLLDGQQGSYYTAWANFTGKPTTLSGYGITDAQAKDAGLTSISALTGAGVLTATATDTFVMRAIGVAASTDIPDRAAADTRYLQLGGGTLTGYLTLNADPTNALHPATKQYVDALVQGLDPKGSVKAASTANITLTAPGATIDGVTMVSGDLFLAKDQTTASQNGIYVWNGAAVAATRATNMDVWAEVPGSHVWVEQGSTLADTGWVCSADQGGTLGTTAISWQQFGGPGSFTAGTGLALSGNQFSLTGQALSLHNLSTTGFIRRTGANTFSATSLTGAEVTTALGYTPWHAGNDGVGSTLDADLLDGQQGTYYTDIVSRLGYTPVNRAIVSSWSSYTIAEPRFISGATDGPGGGTTFIGVHMPHASAAYATQLAGRIDQLFFRTLENGVMGSWLKIWHEGNDGGASGLDADLLDGQHGSYYTDISSRLGYTPVNPASATFTGLVNVGVNNIQGSSSTNVLSVDDANDDAFIAAGRDIALIIDSDNNGTTATFSIKRNASTIAGSTAIFTVAEAGAVTMSGTLDGVADPSSGTMVGSRGYNDLRYALKATTLAGYGITDAQPLAAKLTNLAAMSSTTGIVIQSGTDSFIKRTLGVGAGLSIADPSGVGGNPTISLDAGLSSIAGLTGAGVLTATATDVFAMRSIGAATSTDILDRDAADGRYPILVAGTNTFTGAISLNSPNPSLRFVETDQTAPAGGWFINANNDTLYIRHNTATPVDFSTMNIALSVSSTEVVNFTNTPLAGGVALWHANNDGAASGLDADLLDGQQGSYYAPIASPSFTGNVGIGTATPGAKLEVVGGSALDGATTTIIIGSGTNTANSVHGIEFRDRYGAFSAGGQIGAFIRAIRESSAGHYDLHFGTTDDNALDATTKMVLMQNGNVGIGTTSNLDYRLTVAGTAVAGNIDALRVRNLDGSDGSSVASVFALSNANYAGITATRVNSTTGRLSLGVRTSSVVSDVLHLYNGSVGIGTTTPGTTNGGLDISSGGIGLILGADNGASTRTNATAKYGRLAFSHYTNAEEPFAGLVAGSDGSNNTLSIGGGSGALNSANILAFYTGTNTTTLTGTERMRITNIGNVGIGTTNPVSKLEIVNAAALDVLIDNTGTGNTTLTLDRQTSSGEAKMLLQDGGVTQWGIGAKASSNNFVIRDADTTERLTILKSNGNVGIGVTAPVSLLHVNAPVGTIGTMTIGGGNLESLEGEINARLDFKSNDPSVMSANNISASIVSVSELYNGSRTGLGFYTYTQTGDILSEKMRISHSGNVGIGTTTPLATLNVSGTNRATNSTFAQYGNLLVNTTDAQAINMGGVISLGGMGSSGAVYTYANIAGRKETATAGSALGYLAFETDNNNNLVERMRITSAGLVGIGTTIPTASLTVVNNANALVGRFANNVPSAALMFSIERQSAGVATGATRFGFSSNDSQIATTADFVIYTGNTADLNATINGTERFRIAQAGNVSFSSTSITASGNIVWHAGNDGAASGLDADLLDGQQGSYYRTLANLTDKASGTTIGTLTINAENNGQAILVKGGTSGAAYIAMYKDAAAQTTRSGYFGFGAPGNNHFYLYNELTNGNINLMPNGTGVVNVGSSLVWHAGNDGASSGLDADLLDGQHGSYYQNASNLTSGTIADARLSGVYSGIGIKLTGTNTIFGEPNTGTQSNLGRTVTGLVDYRNSGSAATGAIVFIAPTTATAIMHRLKIEGMIYTGGPTVCAIVQGYKTTTWTQTSKVNLGINDIQVRFGTTPDGKSCVILGDVGTTWNYTHIGITHAMFSHSGAADNYCSGWTSSLVTDLSTYTNVTSTIANNWGYDGTDLRVGGSLVWDESNDGASSGLDADLLDGQQGSYYLSAANLNAGILPDARLSGTYTGVNISGNAGTATTLQTARTIGGVSFNGSANINLPGVNTAGNQNTTGSAATLTTGRTLAITGDLAWTSPSFNGSANVTAAGTLATVNANVGSFGSATQVATFTVDAKGRTTAAGNVTIALPWSAITSGKPTTISGYGITDLMSSILAADGSGSGLDADLLDGAESSSSATNSTVALRDGSGYLWANRFNLDATGYFTLSSGNPTINFDTNDYVVYDRTGNSFSWVVATASVASIASTGSFSCTGDITAYSSDARLKTNVQPIANALDKIESISGYTFDWDRELVDSLGFTPYQYENEHGFLAQEIQKIVPDAVRSAHFNSEYYTVKYERVVPLAIQGIKELKKLYDDTKSELDELKALLKAKGLI